MKKELSAIELHYVLEEMKQLENSRLDRIYQPGKDEILIQVHKTGIGKAILKIKGKLMYLTEHKPESPATPFGFVTYLRKKLSNSVLREIRQIGSERIAEIVFETKETRLKLIVELFGSGNIILADEKDIIMSPMTIQKFKDREIKPGERYAYPPREHNIFDVSYGDFYGALKKSKQDSLVKALALDLGLGGTYSEELCLLSKIGKDERPAVSEKDAREIFSRLKELLKRKTEPVIVLRNKDVIDITPFSLERYAGFDQKKAETYNKALDSVITERIIAEEKAETKKETSKELEKVKKSIDMQEKNIEKLRKEAEESQRKGELIYERYSEIKDILDELNKARKKYSFSEIREKLKGHKVIKEINEKEGKILIEI